jgi:release factor glutamine methyltransferase
MLEVGPAVLVPRPETELLVELALERGPASVLDLGTGCGAIALAIKRHAPGARVVASDASRAALGIARRNAAALGLEVELREGSWFAPVRGERFALVVCNPPYVASADPHLQALRYEPRRALVAGADGLDAIRTIVREAPAHLLPAGSLLLEHGWQQADAVRQLMNQADFLEVRSWPDLAGIARVTGGKVKS